MAVGAGAIIVSSAGAGAIAFPLAGKVNSEVVLAGAGFLAMIETSCFCARLQRGFGHVASMLRRNSVRVVLVCSCSRR